MCKKREIYAGMASETEINPENFECKEVVLVNKTLCTIIDIQNTHLGYRSYLVKDMKDGETFVVGKHQIQRPTIQDLDIVNVNWDEEIQETEYVALPEEHAPVPTRHAVMDEESIQAVAKARLSENSEKQTKWAVALFKGM